MLSWSFWKVHVLFCHIFIGSEGGSFTKKNTEDYFGGRKCQNFTYLTLEVCIKKEEGEQRDLNLCDHFETLMPCSTICFLGMKAQL